MVHVLLVGTWPSWSCVIDSVMSNMAGSLCRDLAFLPAPVAALRPVEFIGDLRITVRASPSGVPHPSSSPQLAGVPLDRAGTSAVRGTPPDSYCAPLMTRCRSLHWRALSLSLWEWWLGCIAPFGCGSIVRARPRDNGYAFLGRRALMSGSCGILPKRVVSQWGSGWFSAPPSGAILPGSAWGAYKFVEGTFHCPKKIFLPPHHPRWWSLFGVHGHPLCGAVCGHATMSDSHHYSAGWAVPPLRGL